MTKLFFKTGSILMIAFCLVLTSCQDDLTTTDRVFNYEEGVANGIAAANSMGSSCFELVYPVTIELSDGTQLAVADNDELKEAAINDVENNGEEAGRPELVYPVEVIVDGVTQSVEDLESLQALIQGCRGGKDRNRSRGGNKGSGDSCFSLVFPLTINFADGSSVTAASREEAREAVQAFNEANPDSEDSAELEFPVTVTLADETEQELASQEELDALKESCVGSRNGRGDRSRSNGKRGESCFSLVYPATYAFEDGSTVTVDDREALRTAFTEYKEANPETSERPQIQYPISIAFEDETTQSIASEEELLTAKEACDMDDDMDDNN